ncbi:methyltransferase [Segetibacter sp.]|jgi:tRNA1Val (adenine37-N6)-methyltransferase|uniref:tRNA1(Val) (adenine(37)-N6)-methyltransferase n=1 Tax=Segetibacter sp. TaxID=2231182 RepID=UPI002634D313|nr:methyltransferase [Segetibacter sp.]MCW3080798.1 methyltransferase [Segetibacter sp.]
MSNSYFQFKQFKIHQQKSAMKVCTDACLFGAWVADKMEGRKIKNVLDIGTGTGLLSLMIAQKIDAEIDAVEIDEAAAEQAKENFKQSPYADVGRLNIVKGDVRKLQTNTDYDLIVSNPPFYNNDLKSVDQQRNLALHSISLSFEELVFQVVKYLKPNGFFAVLLPFARSENFISTAERRNLFLFEQMLVKQTEEHQCFRSMLLFSKSFSMQKTSEISIKKGDKYSAPFVSLLKDYYLYL